MSALTPNATQTLPHAQSDVLFAAGLKAHQAGNIEEAKRCYEQLLQQHPTHGDALNLLGVAYDQQGQHATAKRFITEALQYIPHNAEAHNNLGLACVMLRQYEEAYHAFKRATELAPNYAMAWTNLAKLCYDTRRFAEAIEAQTRACEAEPNVAYLWCKLTVYAMALQAADMAIDAIHTARRLAPNEPSVLASMGELYQNIGQIDVADAAYRDALALFPDVPGSAYYAGTEVLLRRAAMINPVPMTRQEMDALHARLRAELVALYARNDLRVKNPMDEAKYTLFYLAYYGKDDTDIYALQAKLWRKICPLLTYVAPHCMREPGATQKTVSVKRRVGFVSTHFVHHTITALTLGLIEALPRDHLEVIIISAALNDDSASARALERVADRVVRVDKDLASAQRVIADLELDILYYTDIGMDPFTYYLAFARLAPVQCVSWGHPVTCGIDTIDYFISSTLIEPENATRYYHETLVTLPYLPACYHAVPTPPARTRAYFQLPETGHCYVCPQSIFKLHPDFDDIIARLLQADPEGFVVILGDLNTPMPKRHRERLQPVVGEQMSRVHYVPGQAQADFHALLCLAGVMLDPLHFGGGNTTFEALSLGVPIVTWPGNFMRGRVTLGCYQQMGVMDLVADSAESYVALAVRCASDANFRAAVVERLTAARDRLIGFRPAAEALAEWLRSVECRAKPHLS